VLTSASLLHRIAEHDRRRRQAAPALRVPVALAALGGALAFEIARRDDLVAGSRLWLTVLITTSMLAFVTAPFRLFWSSDADALARYPIPGGPLFRLGMVRNLRVASAAAAVPAMGLAGFAVLGSADALARHALFLAVGWAGAALLAPAASLAAGALAASDRADAIVRSVGGEFQPPRGAYLGVVPGIAGALVVLALIADQSWLLAAADRPIPGLALASIAFSIVAIAIADRRATTTMPGAVRELSALNRRRLAHVDVTRLTALERVAVGLSPSSMRPVLSKDFRLLRRRYPAYFLVQAGAAIGTLIAAATAHDVSEWISATLVAVHAYSILMAWRSLQPPVEEPVIYLSIPLTREQRRAVKRRLLLVRTIAISATVGVALALATSLVYALVVAGGAAVLTTAMGAYLIARRVR